MCNSIGNRGNRKEEEIAIKQEEKWRVRRVRSKINGKVSKNKEESQEKNKIGWKKVRSKIGMQKGLRERRP